MARMNGIDISNNQKEMNLAGIPHDFAIVKVSGGNWYTDEYARDYLAQEVALGKPYGGYHFAHEGYPASNVMEEVNYFMSHVDKLPLVGRGILVLDYETAIAGGTNYNQNDVVWCKTFLDEVYRRTQVRPLLYLSKSVTNQCDWSSVSKDYGLWGAQYANMTRTGYQESPWTDSSRWGSWGEPAIFQYSSSGQLAGYNGRLDINVAYMDASAWQRYAVGDRGNAPAPTPETPTEYSINGKNLEHLAGDVQAGYLGNGDNRRAKLGNLYNGVQAIVDHRYDGDGDMAIRILAQEAINGHYGNGETRKFYLGTYYEPVQAKINQMM